jgi:hypothetical protein
MQIFIKKFKNLRKNLFLERFLNIYIFFMLSKAVDNSKIKNSEAKNL